MSGEWLSGRGSWERKSELGMGRLVISRNQLVYLWYSPVQFMTSPGSNDLMSLSG
jgi:hypothetical protein